MGTVAKQIPPEQLQQGGPMVDALTGDLGEMTLRVTVEADCSIEGFIHKSDYYIVDSGEVRVIEDWNDHMFRASEQRRLRFTLSGDFPEDTVDDITLTVVEVEDVSS